ncbi:ATP-binding protein [Sutterella wadsworthensis]|uniref:ATP-binding protein n=1 Tax=Sutterella wadsworthensis TaxID=40545 RepID=UPI0024301E8F|nr:ATP-binding protein [Sutterella wadsworthensis]
MRYTPQGGRIELSSSIVNGRSVVRVSDNGPGIAPDERARVFDRFYRALGTKTSGTGLGTCHCQTHRRHSSWHSHD